MNDNNRIKMTDINIIISTHIYKYIKFFSLRD